MLQSMLATFREGVESFLIVAVVSAYLRRTNRAYLLKGVRIGVGLSVVTCLAGAWLWLQVPNQSLVEGIAALTAAVLVGGMLWQMNRMGRHLKGDIEARVEKYVSDPSGATSHRAVAGIALITTLLVTREGLEAVLYVGVKAMAARAPEMRGEMLLVLTGAVLGLVLAGVVAWYWNRMSLHLNLIVVLKVTAVFLALFLVQLVVYGIHELAESGVIHGSQAFHDATEVLGPDGSIGHFLSYSLIGAPLLYMLWSRRHKPRQAAAQG
jgi:high-affinity iron transporter